MPTGRGGLSDIINVFAPLKEQNPKCALMGGGASLVQLFALLREQDHGRAER